MVDGLHKHIQNRMKKPLAIALSGVEKCLRGCVWGGDGGKELTNVQCKALQNCHNLSPPCTMNIS
jgi:hypothetical protein